MDKFEVGKEYFSWETRYSKGGNNLVWNKIIWLCVKRNDSTGYVSFRKYFQGRLMGTQYSRKVEYEWDNGKKTCEMIKIGYGGNGSWRNWYVIRANQKI